MGYSQGSYSALEIPYHIRTLSMSGISVADDRGMDVSAVNPALLAHSRTELLVSLARYPADIQSEAVEWRLPGESERHRSVG